MAWIKGKGVIDIDNGVRIVTRIDMCYYYKWLIEKAHWDTITTQIPKHKAHITIINPKIHDCSKGYCIVESFRGKRVDFFYDPEAMFISKVNFWMPAMCDDIEKPIKYLMRVQDAPNYLGLHMTVANVKFNNNKNE